MKQTILLSLIFAVFTVSTNSQKLTAYAITSNQKGQSNWSEVKLVDLLTGEEIKPIYRNDDEVSILNARTGKPVVKKDVTHKNESRNIEGFKRDGLNDLVPSKRQITVLGSDKLNGLKDVHQPIDMNNRVIEKRFITRMTPIQSDKPFATNSAACAYDKKHDRLYYTPLGINQLRYIDLRSKSSAIFYFEDELFGALSNRMDVPNQITRMVIGSDGNGYALTNNGNHLIRFTTNKKAVITDLGALTDDPVNGKFSIHSQSGFGGDMIAGDKGNLFVITANRAVHKIDVGSMIATYLGSIKGLPAGYSTNGAIVEKGTTIIVSSANSTLGYFKFDLSNLNAEQIPNKGVVFNASDLANSTLLSEKKSKKQDEEVKPEEPAIALAEKNELDEISKRNNIAVFPNPVAIGGTVKLSFKDQLPGKYAIQLMDISGKLIDARQVYIANKYQVEEYKLPGIALGKGNYLLKVVSSAKRLVSINTLLIQ